MRRRKWGQSSGRADGAAHRIGKLAEAGAERLVEIDPRDGKVTEIACNLPIRLVTAPIGLPTNIPTRRRGRGRGIRHDLSLVGRDQRGDEEIAGAVGRAAADPQGPRPRPTCLPPVCVMASRIHVNKSAVKPNTAREKVSVPHLMKHGRPVSW